ncbi:VPLPA-CTERM sorting domain-containing protein [Thioclava kandeliae]|uniref:VPLPA-CTERM sorting domain-containing protein n=1 Tax=Thioclava kandeliae TaxID=3070818 RepID=A0ABV1SM73_9RHOB
MNALKSLVATAAIASAFAVGTHAASAATVDIADGGKYAFTGVLNPGETLTFDFDTLGETLLVDISLGASGDADDIADITYYLPGQEPQTFANYTINTSTGPDSASGLVSSYFASGPFTLSLTDGVLNSVSIAGTLYAMAPDANNLPAVPLPASALLLMGGMAGLGGLSLRKRRKAA